jgi:hypothetical protein
MAKSEPSWSIKAHKQSIAACLSSLKGPVRVRTRGCIIREAWSEKLTRRVRPSIVCIARFFRGIDPSGRSQALTKIGTTSCRYSSMFAPNVRSASNTFICVLATFSFISASKTLSNKGRIFGKNGLNSASSALPSASTRDASGSCSEGFSHSSLMSSKMSTVYFRTCCLMMPTRIVSCSRWNTCTRAADVRATSANAGMIYLIVQHANK